MSKPQKNVGRVSTRQATPAHGDVGLRPSVVRLSNHETANPTDGGVAGEWPVQALEEVAELSGGFAFKSEDYSPEGRFILRTLNIKDDGSIDRDSAVFLPLDKCDLYKRFELQEHDTLFVMVGATLGKVGYVRRETLPALLNQNMWRIRARVGLCDKRYLQYAYRHTVVKNLGWASGSARDFVRRDDYRSMVIPIPPLPEQKSIAHILGTLDDKIELNRRMNATLEAMARALFQSWFVDFDPVRAKLDGREPAGLDAATAAFFPEHLEDSPLGHIPLGWEVKAVGDIGDVICGKTPPTSVSDYYGEDIPFITIPDMHGNVFGAATARKLSHAGANSQVNKTLPPGSLCVSCIATPGLVVITSEDSQTNQQINSVVPHEKEATYFWYWVMTGLGAEIASSGSGGSVLVNLSKGRFETIKIIKPPHALIRAYHVAVAPMFENILANTDQSHTLATLRDTLLPKLLSGELSVSDAT